MNKYFLLLSLAFSLACNQTHYKNPHIIIETRLGDIEVELYPDKAPKTVAAILQNINTGIYDNSSFYRVLKAEELPTDYNTGIIQGGVWKTHAEKALTIPGINHESTNQTGLSHTSGTISMARTDTGSAKTEFFICIGDQSSLDFGRKGTPDGMGYAAFGKVFSGMAIVKKIQAQKSSGNLFNEPIGILKITER